MTVLHPSAQGQDEPPPTTMFFVFLYHQGPSWDETKSVFEQPLQGHFGHMTKLQEEGVLIIGGPFKDGTGATGIIETTDLERAFEIVNDDPGVRDSLFVAEVKPWHPSVVGCIEPREW